MPTKLTAEEAMALNFARCTDVGASLRLSNNCRVHHLRQFLELTDDWPEWVKVRIKRREKDYGAGRPTHIHHMLYARWPDYRSKVWTPEESDPFVTVNHSEDVHIAVTQSTRLYHVRKFADVLDDWPAGMKLRVFSREHRGGDGIIQYRKYLAPKADRSQVSELASV